MDLDDFNRSRAKRNHNLAFLLYITNTLARSESFDLGRFVRKEGVQSHLDIGVDENGVEEDGNDSGELWIPDDGRLVEEIAAREAHARCGQECPVVTRAMAAQRMNEEEQSSAESE
ncbi:hypothetical protein SUGI_0325010 [Cryptomeria japonica]|nr:hypothetical protein SUGI_0325010 [Cryptomeria japonica]